VGLSELYLEFNDLNTARNHLLKSKVQGERSGFPANRFRWYVAMAQIETGLGNLDGALDLLIEAEGLYVNDFFSNVRPISAMKARLWIRQGRLGESFDWSREQGLSSGDDLHYLREFEHITIARLLLAQYKDDRAHSILLEAMRLLERLLQAAEEGERTGSIIEILILQAMSYYLQGDLLLALVPLERTLKLAEPEGYIQIFLKEGQPMEELLEAALKQGISLVYASRLRAAFGRAAGGAPVKNELSGKLLNEPLSERECDVLRLLGTDLSGPEIARELMISLNTLRSHTKNIYDKLEVNNRRAAVRRAEKLGLLS
jgi:LuxR family maltose regulon positive regulatory protein